MDTRRSEGKRRYREDLDGEEEEEEEEEEGEVEEEEDERGFGEDAAGRRKRVITTSNLYRRNSISSSGNSNSNSSSKMRGSNIPPSCQVDNCDADLSEAKQYHRRHKVCEYHAKAPAVHIAELQQRFCQQCSRFHELSEFDDTKRSCRRRLAGHNERRRKHAIDYNGE